MGLRRWPAGLQDQLRGQRQHQLSETRLHPGQPLPAAARQRQLRREAAALLCQSYTIYRQVDSEINLISIRPFLNYQCCTHAIESISELI